MRIALRSLGCEGAFDSNDGLQNWLLLSTDVGHSALSTCCVQAMGPKKTTAHKKATAKPKANGNATPASEVRGGWDRTCWQEKQQSNMITQLKKTQPTVPYYESTMKTLEKYIQEIAFKVRQNNCWGNMFHVGKHFQGDQQLQGLRINVLVVLMVGDRSDSIYLSTFCNSVKRFDLFIYFLQVCYWIEHDCSCFVHVHANQFVGGNLLSRSLPPK